MRISGAAVLLLVAYTVLSAGGMLLVKHAYPPLRTAYLAHAPMTVPALQFGAGAAMYICSFVLWILILIRIPLTLAYPIAVGSTMMMTATGAVFFLKESFTWTTGAGIAVILLGIFMLVFDERQMG